MRRRRCPARRFILDDREAFAALAATGSENFTATAGGLAGAETDLTGAFLAMWAKCRFHGVIRKRGPKSLMGAGGVKREVSGKKGRRQA